MEFKGKLMNQTWENSKKPNFGPNFGPFRPHIFLFCVDFISISGKTLFQVIILCNLNEN